MALAHKVCCTTEMFWGLMCRPSTVRIGRRQLVHHGSVYFTDIAPEDVPGFIEAREREVIEALERRRWPWWVWAFIGFCALAVVGAPLLILFSRA